MTSPQIPPTIIAKCRLIWGPSDYEYGHETDDGRTYFGYIRKSGDGIPPGDLLFSCLSNSAETAYKDMDEKLAEMVRLKRERLIDSFIMSLAK